MYLINTLKVQPPYSMIMCISKSDLLRNTIGRVEMHVIHVEYEYEYEYVYELQTYIDWSILCTLIQIFVHTFLCIRMCISNV